MWTRRCAQCKAELYKLSLEHVIRCACGWVWGEEVKIEGPCPRWISKDTQKHP
jgi:hypothetical protein